MSRRSALGATRGEVKSLLVVLEATGLGVKAVVSCVSQQLLDRVRAVRSMVHEDHLPSFRPSCVPGRPEWKSPAQELQLPLSWSRATSAKCT